MNQMNQSSQGKQVVSPGPTDGISQLSWSKKADMLIASSWDGNVYCWQVAKSAPAYNTNPSSENLTSNACPNKLNHEAPVLSCEWHGDGTKIFSGGCDNKLKMCDILHTGQTMVVGQHDAPIRSMCWIDHLNMLVTGGWDNKIRYWDLKQAQPVQTLQVPGRVYSLDSKKNLLVVGCSERAISVYDLTSPTVEFKKMESPLKMQTRSISCYTDGTGYAVGSIEGRVGMVWINPADAKKNFCFKCHRDQHDVAYPVNGIDFSLRGTFSTCGGDGSISIWDKDSKSRIKQLNVAKTSITSAKFSTDASIIACSVSYDWSKGIEHYNTSDTSQNNVMLQYLIEKDTAPKK